jgi:8-oxo-dGTP pyrophosphatase MutT (NUDIX family)
VTRQFRTLYQIEENIREALGQPLPGSEVHLALAPHPRRGWHPGQIPANAKPAAALILLYPIAEEPYLLLTVRADQLSQHAGQVSFPGGGLHQNETIHEAAVRESQEEVGIDPNQIRLIGPLSPLYIPVSDFALHPILGITHHPQTWQPAAGEVWRVLEVPLAELQTTAGPHRGYRLAEDQLYQVPYLEIGGERVWGATAMILAELMVVIDPTSKNPWGHGNVEEPKT